MNKEQAEANKRERLRKAALSPPNVAECAQWDAGDKIGAMKAYRTRVTDAGLADSVDKFKETGRYVRSGR